MHGFLIAYIQACIVAFLTKAALSAFARLDADSSMGVDLSAREQMVGFLLSHVIL